MSRFDKKGEIDITMTRETHDALLEVADTLPDERDEIIRDLAACGPPTDNEWGDCMLCDAQSVGHDVEKHDPSCPWRRAKELTT